MRSERLLSGRLAALVRALSDQNLSQLPEFHQRVKVGYLYLQGNLAG